MSLPVEAGLLLAPTGPLSDVDHSLCPECAMSDPVLRLNVALQGRYRVERELGEGSSWSFASGPCE